MPFFPSTSSPQRELRDYQRRAVDAVKTAIGNRPVLVAPTGGGKTFMASSLVRELALPTLWLAHRTELIDQGAVSLHGNGVRVGIIKAGREPDAGATVQVASVQTLARRHCMPECGLIVIDECHHAAAGSYRDVLANYPGAQVVGLTATPFRLDGRGLGGDLFGEIIVSASTAELVDAGWLHAPRVYASCPPDLRGVKVTAGDYNLRQLVQRMPGPEEIVKAWRERCSGHGGMRTVAFAVDIDHSQRIAAAFRSSGIPAEHLDGAMPADERAGVLARLASGRTQVVSNCMVLTEGWDLPSLECAIIARPTASLNLHLQMIGRVMRACDGKRGAVVLDHAGNHHVHGLVTRRLTYSLDGATRVGSESLGLRQCRKCFVLFDAKLKACPECGFIPVPARRDAADSENGELADFVEDFDYRRNIWYAIEAERESNGFADGWSVFRYEERFGFKPILGEIDGRRELVDPHNATFPEKEAVYRELLKIVGVRKFMPGWASRRYKQIFGVWPKGFVERARIGERWAAMAGGAK